MCNTHSDGLLAQIRGYAPTHLSGAPRFYALYRRAVDDAGGDVAAATALGGPRLRFVAVGGAAVPRDLVAFLARCFPAAAVSDGYGMTEVPGGIARNGVPLPGVQARRPSGIVGL